MPSATFGIPIDPVKLWLGSHFWYWWGCPTHPDTDLKISEKAFVSEGDTIFSLPNIEISSPYSGAVINRRHARSAVKVSEHYESREFFEISPEGHNPTDDIGYIYQPLLRYIIEWNQKKGPYTVRGSISNFFGFGMDPNNRYASHRELISAADDLLRIKAIKL